MTNSIIKFFRKVQFEEKLKEMPEFHKYVIKPNGGEIGTE